MKKNQVISVLLTLSVSGCALNSGIAESTRQLKAPTKWQTNISSELNIEAQLGDWRLIIEDKELQQLVASAVANNYQLNAKSISLAIARENLNISETSDYPQLSLSVGHSRQKQVSSSTTNYNNDANITAQLSYEVDLWGKLSDEQQQSELTFQAISAEYLYAKNQLIADVVSAWYGVIENTEMLNLYQERASNLQNNLATIKASYQLGLSEALDVYLTQNDVSRELARVAEQKQVLEQHKRSLELLLGEYPTGKTSFSSSQMPELSDVLITGAPSEVLTNNHNIQSAWLDLLSADAGLAVSHKQRFPRFNLTANSGDVSDELGNLLDGGALAWSIAGSITMPIFNAGRLKSLEQQAKLTVRKKEQEYLALVYSTFSDIENKLSNHNALKTRYRYFQSAKENAIATENLAFNQYMKGLISYNTVLEAQRRSFDAQTNVIQLHSQIISNRIAIYVALGGVPTNNLSSVALASHVTDKANEF